VNPYVVSFLNTIKNNTNGIAEAIRLGILMALGFKWIEWTQEQQLLVLGFISALLTIIVGKTTMATHKVDRRVEEQVAHREMTQTTGTGIGMTAPPHKGDGDVRP
jgi:hypothetical protein